MKKEETPFLKKKNLQHKIKIIKVTTKIKIPQKNQNPQISQEKKPEQEPKKPPKK